MTLSFWFPFGDSNFGSFRRDVFRGDIFLLHERWSLPCMRYKYHQRISTLESNSIGRRGATYKTLKKLPEFPERIFFHPEKPCFHHVFFFENKSDQEKKTVWGIPWFQQFVKKKLFRGTSTYPTKRGVRRKIMDSKALNLCVTWSFTRSACPVTPGA